MHRDRNHQQGKKQPTEWEEIFANDISNDISNMGLISKIHNELTQVNIKI